MTSITTSSEQLLNSPYAMPIFAKATHPQVKTHNHSPCVIDAGGRGDCGFLSYAASLLDNVRRGLLDVSLQEGNYDRLMQRIERHFPLLLSTHANLLTSSQQFQYLINEHSASTLIPILAYCLRQLAVDEMLENPAFYRGAFADNTENTAPSNMRQPGTWIDACALTALSRQLKLPTTVHCNGHTYHLTPAEILTSSSHQSACVTLDLRDNHYRAYVSDGDYFTHLASATTLAYQPVADTYGDPDLVEINRRIAEQEAIDLAREKTAYELLSKMTSAQLLTLYQEHMPHSDYLSGYVGYAEHAHVADAIQHNTINEKHADIIRQQLLHTLSKQAYIDPHWYQQHLQSFTAASATPGNRT